MYFSENDNFENKTFLNDSSAWKFGLKDLVHSSMEAENQFPLSDVVDKTPSPLFFHHDQHKMQKQTKDEEEPVFSPIRNPFEANIDFEADKNEVDTLNDFDVEKNDSKSKWANPGLRKFKIAFGLKKKSAIDIKSLSQTLEEANLEHKFA